MHFSLTPEQEAIRDGVARVCSRFDAEYWLQRDRSGEFPHDFHKAIADDGWLGICMPQEYGCSTTSRRQAAARATPRWSAPTPKGNWRCTIGWWTWAPASPRWSKAAASRWRGHTAPIPLR